LPPVLYKAGRAIWRRGQGKTSFDPKRGALGAEYYDETFEKGAYWQKHYTQSPYYANWLLIADRMKRAGVKTVLDLGCGPGQLASLLADWGIAEYTGVDFSQKRIEQARAICPQYKFVQADVFETDLLSASQYDGVVCTEFLEHVEQDVVLLEGARSGARIYITVPNADEVAQRYAKLFSACTIDQLKGNRPGKLYFLLEGVRQ
jgi:2-polyprenyl-3-methyl-5-hydroxy-6-metoxy-1,4-benzoquinol methylase